MCTPFDLLLGVFNAVRDLRCDARAVHLDEPVVSGLSSLLCWRLGVRRNAMGRSTSIVVYSIAL